MTRPINSDQVAWMLAAIRRYLPKDDSPAVSRARDAQAYGLLYELMEVAGLHFQDDAAAHNGTPRDVFMLRQKQPSAAQSQRETMRCGPVSQGGVDGQIGCDAAAMAAAQAKQMWRGVCSGRPDWTAL